MENDKIATYLIEDDVLTRDIVKEFIGLCPSLSLVGEAPDHPTAMRQFAQENFKVDLLISDIETKTINGIDFFKSLKQQPMVIFITSHPHYAVDGFEVRAIDFLVKPFGFARFQKAIQRAESEFTDLPQASGSKEDEGFTFIRSDNQFVKVVFQEVLFVEGLKDYSRIVLLDGTQHITWLNLKGIEESFPKHIFIRVHRSYIVNKMHIKAVGNDMIKVGKTDVPLGHSFKEELLNEISRHSTRR